jgi:hypothetical protein
MRWTDRHAKSRQAKALGRIAYAILRAEEVSGVLEIEGEEKHVRELDEDGLAAQLVMPFRRDAHPSEFSRIQIRHAGRKVFDIRWTKEGDFTTVVYEVGEWERKLLGWPRPIPLE